MNRPRGLLAASTYTAPSRNLAPFTFSSPARRSIATAPQKLSDWTPTSNGGRLGSVDVETLGQCQHGEAAALSTQDLFEASRCPVCMPLNCQRGYTTLAAGMTSSKQSVSLVKVRPVLVCTPNPDLRILQPHLLNAFAVVQIEFAFDNPPSFGIDVSGVVFTYGVGAEATVLRSILFRGFCEEVPMLSGGELPKSTTPCIAE